MTYNPRIVRAEQVGELVLRLEFDDGRVQTVDLAPVLRGAVYGLLSNPAFFRRFRIGPEKLSVVWPNGADFEAAQLYHWPSVASDFARLAQTWAEAEG